MPCQRGPVPSWANLPLDLVASIVQHLPQNDRVAACSVCKGWHTIARRPELWDRVEFATHRDGTRRSELRRLLSLAAWASRYGLATMQLAISARVPPECQPMALKAVSQVALAAVDTLQQLSLITSRGFWPGAWLPRLRHLRHLHLCSMEGGLSLHGDLSPLAQLTSLVLEAKQAVTLQDHVRLPSNVVRCELGCIRDMLPLPVTQLTALRSLAVRRACVSEGVLLTEHEALARLRGLTSLALERQEEEAWLPPPELLTLTALRQLSIAENDCSRWPLHGSDEAFDLMLGRMLHLTSLNLSGCGLEQLPRVLLHAADGDDDESREGGFMRADAADGPRHRGLLRLLAHGNQLEANDAEEGEAARLVFPQTIRQLSIDWQVLHLLQGQEAAARPAVALPRRCRQLALVGREGIDTPLLATLITQLPDLRHLLLEPAAMDALAMQQQAPNLAQATAVRGDWVLVNNRWRPSRLPGQSRQHAAPEQQQSVAKLLQQAGVEALELRDLDHLTTLLDELAT